jgi:hypothetical protein
VVARRDKRISVPSMLNDVGLCFHAILLDVVAREDERGRYLHRKEVSTQLLLLIQLVQGRRCLDIILCTAHKDASQDFVIHS